MYTKKARIIYPKNEDFFFLSILGICSLAKTSNEVKGPRSPLERERCLPPVHYGCYWVFCTVLPAPLEMKGTEGLEQFKEGSTSSFLFTHAYCSTDSILADLNFLLDRELILCCTTLRQKNCFHL